ncbi:uncharacterized protein LOC141627789 [Silene latifolia]|uniref:uncharacterized protein LOC141627789 n=1 Tax=Silene latifolia TaxID=37657 RepID=UPI003D789963
MEADNKQDTQNHSNNPSNFGTPTPTKSKAEELDSDSGDTPNEEAIPDQSNAAIMMAMLQEIQKLHKKFEKIPGVSPTIEEANLESYADSPFMDEIAKIDQPKNFVGPSMRIYDGTTDPQSHVAYYKQRMVAASIPNLINSFNLQFASSRELEKRSSNQYRIKQNPGETIRAFLTRFNKEKVSIPIYVQAKAIGYIRLEEDKSFKAETTDSVSRYERSNRKSSNPRGSSSRPSPYTRPDRSEVNYDHEQGGHTTEECLGLRRQVAYLLKKGYLKDLMPSKSRESSKSGKDRERPQRDLPPTSPIYEVKFINGGSEICSLTSSGISDVHHDGLVITMQIGTARVLRILVDGGSSVNLIILDVLNAMKIDENQIIKKSNDLVGFSGETKNTLGEIYLPTYVEGVSSYERFGVLDCLSSYNTILGRLWIHNVRAIPSTYHQCVKIPTEWGIATIKGEQKFAQECYIESLKPSKTGSDVTDNISQNKYVFLRINLHVLPDPILI